MRSLAIFAAASVLSACVGPTATPSVPPTTSPTVLSTAVASPTVAPSPTPAAPASPPAAVLAGGADLYLLPDGVAQDGIRVDVQFPEGDVTGGRPRVRLVSTGRTAALTPSGTPVPPGATAAAPHWVGTVPLEGAKAGADAYEIVVALRSGEDAVVAKRQVTLSQPIYVVWTLDFEGDAADDASLENTAAIADAYRVPMTIMWNPRVWTTTQVTNERATAMLAWTQARATKADEVALHLHAWTDFVRAAGVTPRTRPNWAGRSDGYDVPLTAYDEAETAKLLSHALKLMSDHGMRKPSSFRAGGLFANAANLRAISAAGFTVDSSATPAGPFGALQLPWTLPKGAQPYRPSRTDANATGDLPLVEVPNNAGNTFGYTTSSVQRIVNDDLALLPRPGDVATIPVVLNIVSHPATIDATERAAIEKLFAAFEPYRYDRGSGPLRFITLSQLARYAG